MDVTFTRAGRPDCRCRATHAERSEQHGNDAHPKRWRLVLRRDPEPDLVAGGSSLPVHEAMRTVCDQATPLSLGTQGQGVACMKRVCKIKPDGQTILRLRLEKGLGRDEVAEKAGISVKTLRNLETKPGYHATPLVLSYLATYFGVDRSALVARSLPATTVLTSTADVIQANIDIASSAREVLLCSGSRARDASYLRAIEAALEANPKLAHYRLMALPPFKEIFQRHLLRLIELRDPLDRSQGYKTIHVGIYQDTIRQPELNACVNETTGLVVLPSIFSAGEYNTAMLTNDKGVVDGLIRYGKTLYQMSTPLETPAAILDLGLLDDGDYYE